MAFEVASVKPATRPRTPNFPLDPGDAKTPGGRFSASADLGAYIQFAYKLGLDLEMEKQFSKLPKSLGSDFYDIEARAPGNPTKDQMRLMMQSLLADRFKLALHFETQEGSVLALTLAEPGKTGPKLRPHSEGPSCSDSFEMSTLGEISSAKDVFPPNCQTFLGRTQPNGATLMGSRNTTMPSLANGIYGAGNMAGEVDKPVIDRTGLVGRFDFTIEYMPDPSRNRFVGLSQPKGDAGPPDSQGPTFLEALRKQLGLKLVSAKGPIRRLVIDHIERPFAN